MIITTTQDVPGMEIVEYKGLATGEVVAGIKATVEFLAPLMVISPVRGLPPRMTNFFII